MTEPASMEPFETRFADRVQAYTDRATERPIDAFEVARAAMSTRRASARSGSRPNVGIVGPRIAGVPWVAALVPVILIGMVGIALLDRSSDAGIGPEPNQSPTASGDGQIPDVLAHSWQRPYAVTPDLDQWSSGFLRLADGRVGFGSTPGAEESRSVVRAAGPDTLVLSAGDETKGCTIGDIGAYRWSVAGKGTVMTLTVIGADACAARETALAGQWVRADLPPPADAAAPLSPGTYPTSAFDPFGVPGAPGQLSYTVPEGWKVKEDSGGSFLLHLLPDSSQGQPTTDTFIFLFAQPRMAAEFDPAMDCGPFSGAPGVGRQIDDIVAAIRDRPGVVSTTPTRVTIGGHAGQMLDLRLEPSWTGGCEAPEGPIVGVPILVATEPEMGPSVGIGPDQPMRLILLDLTDARTVAIAISCADSQAFAFEEQVAPAMAVIETFAFQDPTE